MNSFKGIKGNVFIISFSWHTQAWLIELCAVHFKMEGKMGV